jgi:16S rRNA processing protein RimM
MTAPEQAAQWVWLARVRRPQGRKGEVFADILTDFPEKFAERRHLWLVANPDSLRANSPSAPVKGADFSPYIKTAKSTRALAPGGHSSRGTLGLWPNPSAPREVELIAHWLHKGGIVLHFAGIDSISAAETLAGLIVAIPRADRAALAEDEVYIADLIGCTLYDVAQTDASDPVRVGQIEDIDRTAGPVALLVVRGAGAGEEILIPFAKSYLRTLDLAARRVEMALPEGLAGLNAPEKS